MLRLLAQRNVACLWSAGLLSGLGNWMMNVALPFSVFQRTGSTAATGGLFIVELLPGLLAGSLAGVLVDRWDRRRTMIAADTARTVLVLLLLASVHSPAWLWLVYTVVFLESAFGLLFDPASGALLPRLVDAGQLGAANALISMSTNVVRLAGSALGGVVLGLFGLPAVVILDSASYACSAALIALIHAPLPAAQDVPPDVWSGGAVTTGAGRTLWRAWTAGLWLVWHAREVRALFLIMGLAMLADGFYLVLLVPFVRVVLHGDALILGWVQAALGAGGLIGGLLAGTLGMALPPRRLLALSLGGVGVVTLILAATRSLSLVIVMGVLLGIPITGWLVSQDTLMQRVVPDAYRGRILGTYGTTITLLLLGGMGLASLLVPPLGPAATLAVAGMGYLGAALVALVVLSTTHDALHPAEHERAAPSATEGESARPAMDNLPAGEHY